MQRRLPIRIKWVDDNLDQINIVHCTVTYKTDQGEVYATESARISGRLTDGPDAPEKPGYIFTGWYEEKEGSDHNGYYITGDVTFIPHYMDEKTAVDPAAIFLRYSENWTTYSKSNEDLNTYYFESPFILPKDAVIGKVQWISSDERLLSFDEPGVGTIKGTGDVDITIMLRNGISTKMRLHILSEEEGKEPAFPTGMTFDQSSYAIGTGDVIQILPKLQPQGIPLENPFYIYKSSDESVAEIVKSESGIIIGKKPGKAKITKLKKGTGSITVKWKKQSAKIADSHIMGYQVQLATNKKFTKGKKTLSIKGYRKTSRKISGLMKNKKYYVRIRTYQTIKGIRLCSPWSKTRAIRTGK